ncbi:hypothetical protein Nepgr_031769 [Nepenthes gracilis]|uniref:Uncharacterized protein n=1 Tax=Nepenthes gracilis TaxID=150966 RepID=A0AAD3Y7S9_NEPGR|nr:hypothetical protein Nepgr_031769 [Nepenthes gracilis]
MKSRFQSGKPRSNPSLAVPDVSAQGDLELGSDVPLSEDVVSASPYVVAGECQSGLSMHTDAPGISNGVDVAGCESGTLPRARAPPEIMDFGLSPKLTSASLLSVSERSVHPMDAESAPEESLNWVLLLPLNVEICWLIIRFSACISGVAGPSSWALAGGCCCWLHLYDNGSAAIIDLLDGVLWIEVAGAELLFNSWVLAMSGGDLQLCDQPIVPSAGCTLAGINSLAPPVVSLMQLNPSSPDDQACLVGTQLDFAFNSSADNGCWLTAASQLLASASAGMRIQCGCGFLRTVVVTAKTVAPKDGCILILLHPVEGSTMLEPLADVDGGGSFAVVSSRGIDWYVPVPVWAAVGAGASLLLLRLLVCMKMVSLAAGSISRLLVVFFMEKVDMDLDGCYRWSTRTGLALSQTISKAKSSKAPVAEVRHPGFQQVQHGNSPGNIRLNHSNGSPWTAAFQYVRRQQPNPSSSGYTILQLSKKTPLRKPSLNGSTGWSFNQRNILKTATQNLARAAQYQSGAAAVYTTTPRIQQLLNQ